MESTTSLVKKLQGANLVTRQGKTISFQQGDGFYWDPKSTTVLYDSKEPNSQQLLLHELGHALSGHGAYNHDIELIAMERAAWEQALQISEHYDVTISEDLVEEYLDSYRDWLHARSLCPHCAATGVQTARSTYQCLNCHCIWQVNDARSCGLRRYKSK